MSEPPGPLPTGLARDNLVGEVALRLAELPDAAIAIVAVSGGADSTALAYLAAEARPDLTLVLAHVRHGIRDDTADVAAVTAHASALGVRLVVTAVDVEPDGEGWEAAARDERYLALVRACADVGAAHLLVGHTADDQAETVLLRAARGTGVDGLAAIAPLRRDDASGVTIVRPLLRVRRSEVRRFVELEGLVAVEDPTNRDPQVRRVRVRDEVLPALERVAPDPVGALARLADLARDDAAALEALVDTHARRLLHVYGSSVAVRADELESLGPALGRRLVRRLLQEVRGPGLPVDAVHVEAVRGLAPGEAVDVPGARVSAGGGWIAAAPAGTTTAEASRLVVPGATSWPAADLEIVAEPADVPAPGQARLPLDGATTGGSPRLADAGLVPPSGDHGWVALVVAADDVPATAAGHPAVEVRSRRPGDRLRTGAGTKKLHDVLVDAGVPRVVRDLVPVVARGDDVLWVAGVTADVDVAARGRERPAIRLRLVRPLPPGSEPL